MKLVKKKVHHYNIIIKGRVQRVSYRVWAQTNAAKLGLNGFVKNLHNGDVYIEAEGSDESINRFIDLCYVGSPLSKVTEVIVEEQALKNFETFELKR